MISCSKCGKEGLVQNEVGLSQKYHGRATTTFYCYSCMAQSLGLDEETLAKMVRRFQQQGCGLFSPLRPEEREQTES